MPKQARATAARKVRQFFQALDEATTKDIERERQRLALQSTVKFVDENLRDVQSIRGTDPVDSMYNHLRYSLSAVSIEGLTVEFGVGPGNTLREICAMRGRAFGFDSFEGLPEVWRPGYAAGAFAQTPPTIPGAELVTGWFNETLPSFLEAHPEPFAFVHMDADLYSSTQTIFDLCFDRFIPGTVIVFNEYFNYPGWELHEHQAFLEFLARFEGGFKYLAYNSMHEQLSVVLT